MKDHNHFDKKKNSKLTPKQHNRPDINQKDHKENRHPEQKDSFNHGHQHEKKYGKEWNS